MKENEIDYNTEQKIKKAAEKLFLEKGFSGTRTRDISKEAGINLALLNYYYRSKENLYAIIMMEKLEIFFDTIIHILGDTSLDFPDKATIIVNKYTDMLIHEPRLPLFLLSEIQQNPDFFASKLNIKDRLRAAIGNQPPFLDKSKEESLQILLSSLGVVLFPFIVRHVIEDLYDMNDEQYNQLLNDRREFVPQLLMDIYKK